VRRADQLHRVVDVLDDLLPRHPGQLRHWQVALLRLEQSGIRVASYLTELPSQELLRQKLHDAVRIARARLEDASQT